MDILIFSKQIVKSINAIGILKVCSMITNNSMDLYVHVTQTIVIIFSCPLCCPQINLPTVIKRISKIKYSGNLLLLQSWKEDFIVKLEKELMENTRRLSCTKVLVSNNCNFHYL